MRTPSIAAALLLAFAAVVEAQGRIIPRPCAIPRCRDARECAPPPCPSVQPIVRTSSDVRVEMRDRVLRYEITETFVNRGGAIGEADYLFPLPQGAAFEDLKLSINGELVSGETMNAADARRIYEEIVRRQRDPALVEWMGSGLLRTRIFPIAPGEEKKVVVRFQTVAVREGSSLRLDYTRASAPRSLMNAPIVRPATAASEDARSFDESGNAFTLAYEKSSDLGEPYSPTHMLRTRDRGRMRVVTASGEGREITILVPLARTNAAALTMLAHATTGEKGFALITITPPSAPQRTTSRDVTLVVDVSGSMRGRKMEQARAAGRELLETLQRNDRFRIIDFSTDVRAFRDGWTTATEENLRAARRYVDALSAEGSTNISGALEEALEAKGDGERLPLVVFITDGEPTVGERNPDAIAAAAARNRGEARIFTFGVGAEVNAGLVEQLAVEGRGTAHFVRNDESVERAVSLLASRLTNPVLTAVRVRAEGVRLEQMHPSGPADLFVGQDLVLFTRYDGDGEARLRVEGRSASGPVSWTTTVRFPERERNNPFVARLWATQRLGWLAAEKRKRGGTTELDEEIRTLGTRYGIPTEFSSYLVLEPGMQVARRADGAAPQRQGSVPDVASADRNARLRDQSGRPVELSATVVTGAAVAAPSAEQRFESAKSAAAQRTATSLASVDSIVQASEGAGGATVRRIGERTFTLTNGVWTDGRYQPAMKTIRVKAYSAAYFDLIRALDGLSAVAALGDRVVVAGRGVAIEIGPVGAEQLAVRELSEASRAW